MLVVTLALTIVATFDIGRRDEVTATVAARYLLFFTILFLGRVAGQIVVLKVAPAWLPPMNRWNLVPYRILLPAQVLILAVMGWIVAGIWLQYGPISGRHPAFGTALLWASGIYAGVMAIRYVVRMKRRPEERWFGGAIPIVFHMVLAAFLFTWGRYHTTG